MSVWRLFFKNVAIFKNRALKATSEICLVSESWFTITKVAISQKPKKRMDIFAHSDDLLTTLFVEWIDVADVVFVDRACAVSKCTQENLRRILTAKQVVLHNNAKQRSPLLAIDNILFGWLSRTKVKLVKLVITPHMAAEDLQQVEEYLILCGPALQSLRCIYYDRQIMSTAMKHGICIKELCIDCGSDIEEGEVLYSKSIETLDLRCSGSTMSDDMDDDICIKLPNLKNLTLAGRKVLDALVIGIVQHTPELQYLRLEETPKLTVTSYSAIGRYCRNLECLSITGMSYSSAYLTYILPFTPRLIELEISYSHGDLNVQGVFEAVAANSPNLATLTLTACDSPAHPAVLQAFVHMLTRCVHLRRLNMSTCKFVTDDYLFAIAAKAKKITHLEIYNCNVSNNGLTEVAIHCVELEYVGLGTRY